MSEFSSHSWLMLRRALHIASVSAVMAACTSAGASAPLPPRPPVVEVTAREYRFDHTKAIPRGRVVFELVNVGTKQHRMTLIPLPADLPPLEVQARSKNTRVVDPQATTTPLAPGGKTSFATDLGPGRYGLICIIPVPGGLSHYRQGMVSEFRVP